jgi:secreted trypsin-like serine protease
VGDSGGPLLLQKNGRYRQIAIVSYGQGCGKAHKYGVYTFLPSYADWIHQFVPLPIFDSAVDTEIKKVNSALQSGSISHNLLLFVLLLIIRMIYSKRLKLLKMLRFRY